MVTDSIRSRVDRLAGSYALSRKFGLTARAFLALSQKKQRRICVYYASNRISFSQIYPFVRYRQRLAQDFGVGIEFRPVERFLKGLDPPVLDADHILFQPWFTIDRLLLTGCLEKLRATNPLGTIDFVDSFAPNDLRLAKYVNPYIRHYFKKSLFREREKHLAVWRGDTNISDYMAEHYHLQHARIDHEVPAAILPKLRFSPVFFTAARFWSDFSTSLDPPERARDIDIHARMDGVRDERGHHRRIAFEHARNIPGNHIISEKLLPLNLFMAEMRRAKICLSPFGYGEVCWRDIEAFQAGAVLVKPDMGHLETDPDIYEAGETYLPVKWDYSDLEEVVSRALADPELCRHLTHTAWRRIHTYLTEDRFVSAMKPIWQKDPIG